MLLSVGNEAMSYQPVPVPHLLQLNERMGDWGMILRRQVDPLIGTHQRICSNSGARRSASTRSFSAI